MAAVETLFIDAGATFECGFEYLNTDETVFDLTGYTALLHIRETIEGELVLSVVPDIDVLTGTISFTLSAADTSDLTAAKYVYAMEITDGTKVVRLVEGGIVVSSEVVRA